MNHIKKKKVLLERTYDDIGRKYHFDDGTSYYSVTTMLGNTADKSYLEVWRKRVGRMKAEAITKNAGITGQSVHDCCEDYLLGNEVVFPNAVIKNLFKQIKPYIDKYVSNVHATETLLYSDELELAGTVDGIIDMIIRNKTFLYTILDFKTANKQPKVEWVKDYFLQMTIYSMMVREMFGIQSPKGVLMFAYKKFRSPNNMIVMEPFNYEKEVIKRNNLFQRVVL